MANKKISELPYIGVPKISGNTLVPLVTYFSAATGDTVHTYVSDLQTYLISGLTGNTDVFVTGGTYSAGTITITNNTGGTFNITGVTFSGSSSVVGDYLPLSGGTVTGSTQFTQGLSSNTISATTYQNLPINTDVFVTGGTYSVGTSTFTNNTGGTFNVTGFYTGETSYVNSLTTGVGLSADTTTGDVTIINTDPDQVVVLNAGTNINVTGTYPNFTIDVTGLTDFNTFTTGFTYSSNTFTILDNSGNTFDATFTEVTGLTVNGNLNITGTTYSETISATTYQNLPLSALTEGTNINISGSNGNYTISVTGITGGSTFTGGTVSGSTIFTNGLSANTISATTYQNLPIDPDTYTTGYTYSDNTFTIKRNNGQPDLTTTINSVTGMTVNGDLTVTGNTSVQSLTATTISATTYQNLPITTDVFVTGGTYSSGDTTFTNNTGGTFTVTGFYTGETSYVNSLTTGVGLSADTTTGDITIINTDPDQTVVLNDGNNISVTGTYPNFTIDVTGLTDFNTYTTGFTYSSNTFTIIDNSGSTFDATFTEVTGLTVNGDLNITGTTYSEVISATTYQNLPDNITGNYLPLSGGTVSGGTNFTNGLTANTLTVNGVNITGDTYVSGGTYVTGGTISLNYNVGGGFQITGLTQDLNNEISSLAEADEQTITLNLITNKIELKEVISSPSGGTRTFQGNIIVNSGLTANTISASTYQNLPISGLTEGNYINISGSNGNYTISVTGLTQGLSGDYLPLSGGTVTGGTVFTSGVTANTISQTSYIDFTTGSTNPSAFAGRLFFDSGEKALSYFDIINNTVPIAMGQQLYTRVWNNSGVQIDKGKVIAITGTSNNLPSAILATNNHAPGSARPTGVAAENIPSGSEGLVINNGILSGITINTFSNGDTLYLSDTVPGGYVSSTSSLVFSARTNEIGYVIQTGTTTGKIYVNIHNEDSNLTLTDIERNILEGNVISTGAYEYTGMTINSSTTVNVAPMRGWVVQNTYSFATLPDVTNIYYTGGTGITITNIATADATYVLVNSASTLYQQTTYPTPQQRRENIFLGKVVHPNRTSLLTVNNTVDYDVSPMSALRDLWSPIKLINQGVLPSFNTGLTFNTSLGSLYGNGIGWTTNQLNPNSVTISAKTSASFFYRTQTGGTSGSVSVIDPTKYDVNGVITSVGTAGSNDATNQRIYLYPTGVINVLYGQTRYATLTEAIANIDSETFVTYPNAETTAILIGVISVRNDIVDDGQPLTNTNYAKLTLVSKFGESFGGTGGLSTTNLQQAYNNSTEPEILINSTLDGLSIQNGTGNADDVTQLLQGKNTAGTTTSFVRADGAIYGSTISGVTISATTYQNLPVSGLTAGSNINVSGVSGNFTISVTGLTGNYLPISGGTVTGNTIFTSGLTANTLNVTGNTNVRAFTGTTGYISGSGQNILTVIGSGNSTTSPIFTVQGSSGELFSVNDSLVGSLFSVNDISGLPIVEVFSDNTTIWGSYQAPSLNTTTKTSLSAGTNTIYSIPTSAYTGAFYEYTLISSGSTGARAGQIMSIWSGTSANFTETQTTDIGTTTGVTFTVAVSGSNAVLSSSATTAGWTVKTIIRSV